MCSGFNHTVIIIEFSTTSQLCLVIENVTGIPISYNNVSKVINQNPILSRAPSHVSTQQRI